MHKAAIMQPTYFPWIGYFDLMDQVDTFVLLDCVQFEKRSWQQRNRIKTPMQVQWLTVPVISKGRREQRIAEVEIDRSRNFECQHLESIRHAYAKAPFYSRYAPLLGDVLTRGHERLADLTADLIAMIARELGITTGMIRSSSLSAHGAKVERLASICEAVGADHYVSPLGSRGYIEENNLFPDNGIELTYHTYEHPQYTQLHGPFVSHLSIIDVMFNEGDRSLEIIRSGRPSMARAQ